MLTASPASRPLEYTDLNGAANRNTAGNGPHDHWWYGESGNLTGGHRHPAGRAEAAKHEKDALNPVNQVAVRSAAAALELESIPPNRNVVARLVRVGPLSRQRTDRLVEIRMKLGLECE
jgi:hypothetical protein